MTSDFEAVTVETPGNGLLVVTLDRPQSAKTFLTNEFHCRVQQLLARGLAAFCLSSARRVLGLRGAIAARVKFLTRGGGLQRPQGASTGRSQFVRIRHRHFLP